MRAKIVIVPSINEEIYKRTISSESLSVVQSEIGNYAYMHNISGGIDSLVKNGYLVMTSNGSYCKIYVPSICSSIQKIELSEFLASVTVFDRVYGEITCYIKINDKIEKKIMEGSHLKSKIEEFISENTKVTNVDDINIYKDDDINNKQYRKVK